MSNTKKATTRFKTKTHVKKNDMVYVRSGDDKGKKGRVLEVMVETARCPAIELISATAMSINFLSAVAAPTPWLMAIFSKRGTCMLDLKLNCFFKAGTTFSS